MNEKDRISVKKEAIPWIFSRSLEGATTFIIMTLSIMTLSIMTLSIMTLSIMTLSIMTLTITTNKT
jgi:hypothetical protein